MILQFVTAFYETIHEFGCFKKKKITITNEANNESQNEECIELEETNRISTKSMIFGRLSFRSQE